MREDAYYGLGHVPELPTMADIPAELHDTEAFRHLA